MKYMYLNLIYFGGEKHKDTQTFICKEREREENVAKYYQLVKLSDELSVLLLQPFFENLKSWRDEILFWGVHRIQQIPKGIQGTKGVLKKPCSKLCTFQSHTIPSFHIAYATNTQDHSLSHNTSGVPYFCASHYLECKSYATSMKPHWSY